MTPSVNPPPTPVDSAISAAGMLPASAPARDSHVTAQRVTWGIRNRVAMIRGLTPQHLNTALDSFLVGFHREALILWNAMIRRDSTIRTVTAKRFGAVAQLDWEIVTKEKSAEASAHQKALQEFYENLSVVNVLDQDQTGGVELLVEQMASAVGMKYAVHEVLMRPGIGGAPTTAQLNFCPPWWFESRSGRLRYLPADFVLYGNEMIRGEWLVTVGTDVLMEATSLLYLYKWMSVADWANYVERFGLPFVLGKTPASVGSEPWDAVVEMVAVYRGDGGGVVNSDADIEVQQPAASGGAQPHQDLITYCDEKITQLWRGGDLGTQSKGGAAIGASLQQEETDILLAKDARMINSAIRSQLDRMVIEYKFGPGVLPKAQFALMIADEADVDVDIKVDSAFLGPWGLPLPKSDTYRRYGRTEPTSEADTIHPQPKVAAGPKQDPNAAPEPAAAILEAANSVAALIDGGETADRVLEALAQFFAPLRADLQAIAELPDGAMGAALDRLKGNVGGYLITHGLSHKAVSILTAALGDEVLSGLQGKENT